jgi:hypothetical protein
MLRKIAIGLAAATIAIGGLTLNASAMRGGGSHGGGGIARAGGFGSHGGARGFAMRGGRGLAMRGGRGLRGGRAFAMRGGRAFGMRGFRHHRWGWRGRVGFTRFGAWGGSCWRWTPAGRVWVCGRGFGPSFGYSWRGWHHRGGRVFGLRGGRRFR